MATTVAVLGTLRSSAISPTRSPGPSRAISRPPRADDDLAALDQVRAVARARPRAAAPSPRRARAGSSFDASRSSATEGSQPSSGTPRSSSSARRIDSSHVVPSQQHPCERARDEHAAGRETSASRGPACSATSAVQPAPDRDRGGTHALVDAVDAHQQVVARRARARASSRRRRRPRSRSRARRARRSPSGGRRRHRSRANASPQRPMPRRHRDRQAATRHERGGERPRRSRLPPRPPRSATRRPPLPRPSSASGIEHDQHVERATAEVLRGEQPEHQPEPQIAERARARPRGSPAAPCEGRSGPARPSSAGPGRQTTAIAKQPAATSRAVGAPASTSTTPPISGPITWQTPWTKPGDDARGRELGRRRHEQRDERALGGVERALCEREPDRDGVAQRSDPRARRRRPRPRGRSRAVPRRRRASDARGGSRSPSVASVGASSADGSICSATSRPSPPIPATR